MGSQELDMTEATEHTARMHVVAAGLSPEQLLLTALSTNDAGSIRYRCY